MDQNQQSFKCTIKYMFKDCPKPNGWFSCFAHIRGDKDDIKLTGNTNINLQKGMEIQVTAHENPNKEEWIVDELSVVTKTITGIKNYLASMKGVSTNIAAILTKKYGTKTLDMLKQNPDRVKKEVNLSDAQITAIITSLNNNNTLNKIRQAFPEIPAKAAKKLSRHIVSSTKSVDDFISEINSNPYNLSKFELPGVTFKIMDTIAVRNQMQPDDPIRVNHALTHILQYEMPDDMFINLSNVYEYDNLKTQLQKLIALPLEDNDFANRLWALNSIKDSPIKIETWQNERHLYLNKRYKQMQLIIDIVKQKQSHTVFKNKETILRTKWIPKWCLDNNIQLTDEQKDAVVTALTNQISIITGGPGRGKTTVIKCIADIWTIYGKVLLKTTTSPLLLAPTGKAVQKIMQDTKRKYEQDTMTIDRMLVIDKECEYNKGSILVISDESSMLPVEKGAKLLKHVEYCPICFVGDTDQLPPIEAGFLLNEFITSGKIPVSVLTKSIRNSKLITQNSDKIKNMNSDLTYDLHEMPLFPMPTEDEYFLSEIIDRYNIERENCPDVTQIALLAPMRKGIAGIVNINITIQNTVCPTIDNKTYTRSYCAKRKKYLYTEKGFPIYDTFYGNTQRRTNFRIGDIVINTKNNTHIMTQKYTNDDYLNGSVIPNAIENGIYNGDCGTIIAYSNSDNDEKDTWIIVQMFDGRTVELNLSTGDFESFELGYALTVHKAQGCEYDTVIYVSPDAMSQMTEIGFGNKNLIYTAVTRAKKRVVIIGSKQALNDCISTPLKKSNCNLHERL